MLYTYIFEDTNGVIIHRTQGEAATWLEALKNAQELKRTDEGKTAHCVYPLSETEQKLCQPNEKKEIKRYVCFLKDRGGNYGFTKVFATDDLTAYKVKHGLESPIYHFFQEV